MIKKINKNGKILVYTPYNSEFVVKIKRIGGAKWNGDEKCWMVDEDREAELNEILMDVYGETGDEQKKIVAARVTFNRGVTADRDPIRMFGKDVIIATGKHSGAWMGVDVELESGKITSGGSNTFWETIVESGATILVHNLSEKLIEREINQCREAGLDIDIETIIREPEEKPFYIRMIDSSILLHGNKFSPVRESIEALGWEWNEESQGWHKELDGNDVLCYIGENITFPDDDEKKTQNRKYRQYAKKVVIAEAFYAIKALTDVVVSGSSDNFENALKAYDEHTNPEDDFHRQTVEYIKIARKALAGAAEKKTAEEKIAEDSRKAEAEVRAEAERVAQAAMVEAEKAEIEEKAAQNGAIACPDVTVEIMNKRICFHNAYDIKDKLKFFGAKWDALVMAWVIMCEDSRLAAARLAEIEQTVVCRYAPDTKIAMSPDNLELSQQFAAEWRADYMAAGMTIKNDKVKWDVKKYIIKKTDKYIQIALPEGEYEGYSIFCPVYGYNSESGTLALSLKDVLKATKYENGKITDKKNMYVDTLRDIYKDAHPSDVTIMKASDDYVPEIIEVAEAVIDEALINNDDSQAGGGYRDETGITY